MSSQLPPSSLQSEEVSKYTAIAQMHQFQTYFDHGLQTQKSIIGLERAGLPVEVARVAGFLASGFSSYVTGMLSQAETTMCRITVANGRVC